MKSHYQNLIEDIKNVYNENSINGLLNTKVEVEFIHQLVPNLERSHVMGSDTIESLITAITHVARLGLTLSPEKGLASLTAYNATNNSQEYYINVSLAGIEATMSRVNEYKITTLDVVTGDEGISWNGNVLGTNTAVRPPVKSEMIKGAICIIEVPCGDQLLTTITINELKELSRLSTGDLKALTPDFAKRHVFKRALKSLIAPPCSVLSDLQKATKSIDLALFSKQ